MIGTRVLLAAFGPGTLERVEVLDGETVAHIVSDADDRLIVSMTYLQRIIVR